MRLSELATYALTITRQHAEARVRETEQSGLAISCRKGCSACCRQVVPLSPPEAWMIADLVERMPDDTKRDTLQRFRFAADVLQANGMGEAFLISGAVEYFRLGIPCPFLVGNICSIYPNWPVVCHEYMVTSPAYMCSDPQVHSISFVPIRVRISECLAQVAGQLLGWGNSMIPLVRALDWAKCHEAEASRTWPANYLKDLLDAAVLRART